MSIPIVPYFLYRCTLFLPKLSISAEFEKLYDVTISGNITNGTVTANPTQAVAGETIKLTVRPNTGYSITSVKYNVTAINPIEGVYSFEMPAENVTITAEFEAVNYGVGFDGGIPKA